MQMPALFYARLPVRAPVDSRWPTRNDRAFLWEGDQMTREEMLRVMGDGYIARVNGDVDKLLAVFTPDAKFSLNAAPPQPTVSVMTEGAGGMRTALSATRRGVRVQGSRDHRFRRRRIQGRNPHPVHGDIAGDRQDRGDGIARPDRIPRREGGVLQAVLRLGDCRQADRDLTAPPSCSRRLARRRTRAFRLQLQMQLGAMPRPVHRRLACAP